MFMLKTFLQLASKIRRFYWWLARPTTRGVRAIVVNSDGKILLVRHKYGEGWLLPGGKVKKRELDEAALRRELYEEIGLSDIGVMEILGEYENTYEYKRDTILVFVVRSFTQKAKQHFEIEATQYFDPQSLPQGTTPGTRRRIEEWLGQRQKNHQW